MITEVYDIETFPNLFTYTGYCLQTKKYTQFVIHDTRDDTADLYKWLTQKGLVQIGYNNDSFDYPVLHHFLTNYKSLSQLSSNSIASDLYNKAQEIINDTKFPKIRDKYKKIPQLDLFSIWHYDNSARRCSLKDLQFAMKMPNVEEMPFHHSHWCNHRDIPAILEYNKNDVYATYLHLLSTLGETDYPLYKGRDKIELRDSINEKFNFQCLNLPDVTIGEQLMLELYCRATGKDKWEVRKLKTPRNVINLKECIPKWCSLKTPQFKAFQDRIEGTTLIGDDKEYQDSVIFHGIKFDFGLGGSHGCIKPGVYKSKDGWVIMDLDVASLYPSIARSLNLYPEHLGEEFIQLYSQFIDDRIAEKKKPKSLRDNALIEGYKLILNGVYGKSGEETSFLYDPLYMYKTTIAGQLFISMWAERMVEAVEDLTFIQINTDGITIRLKEEDIPKIHAVSNQLTHETTLEIEDSYYDMIVIKDVNNYMAIYKGSSKEEELIKFKGSAFLISPEYHQDHSMKVVQIALKEYFLYGTPVEDTITQHTDIYDFCLRLKINSASSAYLNYYDSKTKTLKSTSLNRTTRYYVSNYGGGLTVFYNGSNSPNRINVGFNCTLFNKYVERNDYDIDYRFYISKANNIISEIEDMQLSLF